MIKSDIEKLGHDVLFDQNKIKARGNQLRDMKEG
jgi:hypothetical protein